MPLTPEQFKEEMQEIAKELDQYSEHVEADALMMKLLRSLGYGEGADIFDKMSKWYA